MRLVLVLPAVADHADLLEACLAFHLNAGVDFVVAGDDGRGEVAARVLQAYEGAGVLRSVALAGRADANATTALARKAASEHAADWVLVGGPHEFWWPRGENLKDVLAPIPPRYTIVNALTRVFLPRPGDRPFEEHRTIRDVVRTHGGDVGRDLADAALRPVFRAAPEIVVGPRPRDRHVPLRSWYPIECLRFPRVVGDDDFEVERGLSEGTLVEDVRLRDALRRVAGAGGTPVDRFPLPSAASAFALPSPDIVETAAYAAECASLGEVDLARLEGRIHELQSRVEWLEARFWPRVLRRVTALRHRRTT